jgi:hypothetical protein
MWGGWFERRRGPRRMAAPVGAREGTGAKGARQGWVAGCAMCGRRAAGEGHARPCETGFDVVRVWRRIVWRRLERRMGVRRGRQKEQIRRWQLGAVLVSRTAAP